MGSLPIAVNTPVIDISGYLAGVPQARDYVVKRFRDACENQGFLQVIGHAVPTDLQTRYFAALADFFSLPVAQKKAIAQAKSPCNRGWEHIGAQKLEQIDQHATADQKESFSIHQERPLGRFLQGPNQWPDNLPNFKEVYLEYFAAVHDLSKSLFGLMALSLDLPEDYFADFASDPDGTCATPSAESQELITP